MTRLSVLSILFVFTAVVGYVRAQMVQSEFDLFGTVLNIFLDPFNFSRNAACWLSKIFIDDYKLPWLIKYDEVVVCTDVERDDCDESNVIRFTPTSGARAQDFLYHSTGPLQLQGIFWFTDQGPCSSIVSFAKTSDSTSRVNTGRFSETDKRGYNTVLRVVGDQNWAYASNALISCYNFIRFWDTLYGIKIAEGSLEDPTRFTVSPIPKYGFFRVPQDICEAYTDRPIVRFDTILVKNKDQIIPELVGDENLYDTLTESLTMELLFGSASHGSTRLPLPRMPLSTIGYKL